MTRSAADDARFLAGVVRGNVCVSVCVYYQLTH